MENMGLIVMLAVVVEALTEYVKNSVLVQDWKTAVVQLCALGVGILVCVAANADLPAALGISLQVPFAGCVITGIFVSRGANYMNDLIGKLRGKKEEQANG